MLQDEFDRLMNLFAQAADGQPVNLDDIFKQAFAFFDSLNARLKEGTEEDKKEALAMMSRMYAQMMMHTKKIAEKTGMTEDQLSAYSENPSNFTPEQWASIQAARNKMLSTGQNLAKVLGPSQPSGGQPTGGRTPAPQAPSPPKQEKEGGGHPKKTKKSKWMKS